MKDNQFKTLKFCKSWLKNTKFYQQNSLIFEEFSYFQSALLLGVFLSIAATLMEGASILLLLTFLRNLSGERVESVTSGISFIDDIVLGINDPIQIRLLKISFLLLMTTLVRAILMYLGNLKLVESQIILLNRLRYRITEQLTSLSYSFFIKSRSGDLVNVMTTEVENLKQGTQAIAILINKGVYLPLYLGALVLTSLQLALIALSCLIVVPVLLIYVRKKVRVASLKLVQANKLISSITFEYISGIQTVLSFSSQEYEKKRFNDAISQASEHLREQNKWNSMTEPTSEFIGFLSIIMLIYLGSTTFSISFSNILGFVYILLRLIQAARQMNVSIVLITTLHGSMDSIKRFLYNDDKPKQVNGRFEFKGLSHEIRIDHVSFGYTDERTILEDIQLTIPKGKTVAFVGSSGSGKSTLVLLLLRLYDPTRGRILLDSVDLRDLERSSVHRKISIVSQDTFLFNATVRDNIAYGLENVSQPDLESAAKTAYALDFIKNLPSGFDTILGDRGVRLSGGQRQRIAIARAILRNPEILILDEATSALDNESEKIVQDAIYEASQNRTVIIIAHRLSTIRDVDYIYVMEKGKIVEEGNYEELIQRRTLFWQLHSLSELVRK